MRARQATRPRAYPTGECYCGCGKATTRTAFFVSSHDRIAEAAVVKAEYGSVADFLVAHGYGPGGKSARDAAPKRDR